MEKCDFCLYKKECIGEVPGPDGKCLGFAVSPEQQAAYEDFLTRKAQEPDFAALCRED